MIFKQKGPTEETIQTHSVRWFRMQYPNVLLYAVPNGGKRGKFEAFRMKLTGTTPGVPDLVIAEPRNNYHGAYIEMKSEYGKLTDTQEKVLNHLKSKGYFTAVCRSFNEFIQIVTGYMTII